MVNLGFPLWIAHDVWRAGDPRAPARGGSTPGRVPLLWAWWTTFLGANALFAFALLGREDHGGDDPTGSNSWTAYHESYRACDHAAGWSFLLLIVAAGPAVAVVARITTFHTAHEAVLLGPGGPGHGPTPGHGPAPDPSGAGGVAHPTPIPRQPPPHPPHPPAP